MKPRAIAIAMLAACSAFATGARAQGLDMLGTTAPSLPAPPAAGSLSLGTLSSLTGAATLPGGGGGLGTALAGLGNPPALPDLAGLLPTGGGTSVGGVTVSGRYEINLGADGGSGSGQASVSRH